MHFHSTRLPYRQTGAFSPLVLDYLDQLPALLPFFEHPPTLSGIQKAVGARTDFPVDRPTLVEVLLEQYRDLEPGLAVLTNIESLRNADTFTVTTAHQNNLFGGPLYVFYKIAHCIRLASELTRLLGRKIVPVFYIGSEDADLEELNHVFIGGEKRVWPTRQTGAVGRMTVDQPLLSVLEQVAGQLGVLPHGPELVAMLRRHYQPGLAIAHCLRGFLHELFGPHGLVILLPDHPRLKAKLEKVWWEELTQGTSAALVQPASDKLEEAGYKAQAQPRPVNLFYLLGNRRERIEKQGAKWVVLNTEIRFTEAGLREELSQHPDRFSPNVILRGLYQEMILPNLAFIGGGGETAYWLQFRELFRHHGVPFPVLVLRNSFLLVDAKQRQRMEQLGLIPDDLFRSLPSLLDRMVARNNGAILDFTGEKNAIAVQLQQLQERAASLDSTLRHHTAAIEARTLKLLEGLEKKMARAARRNLGDQGRQLEQLKSQLFPGQGLQERKEGFIYYLALWGRHFTDRLLENSPALEQEFTVLTAQD